MDAGTGVQISEAAIVAIFGSGSVLGIALKSFFGSRGGDCKAHDSRIRAIEICNAQIKEALNHTSECIRRVESKLDYVINGKH